MSEINNKAAITRMKEEAVVEVTAWPDEVQVVINANDGSLTPDQARELASMLTKAADRSHRLDFEEKPNGDLVLVEKSSATA